MIIPEMSYDGMEVSHGQVAQVVWNDMIGLDEGPEKEALRENLLLYCRQDTLAMVRIHQKLMEKLSAQKFGVRDSDVEILR